MATSLPRVMVTVTDEQHAILTRMAKLQRRPVSSFVRELVDAAMPALRAGLPILEARERTLEEQPKLIAVAARGLLEALQGLDPNQLSLLDITDTDMKDLATAATPSTQREPEERSGRTAATARTARPSPRPRRNARGAQR